MNKNTYKRYSKYQIELAKIADYLAKKTFNASKLKSHRLVMKNDFSKLKEFYTTRANLKRIELTFGVELDKIFFANFSDQMEHFFSVYENLDVVASFNSSNFHFKLLTSTLTLRVSKSDIVYKVPTEVFYAKLIVDYLESTLEINIADAKNFLKIKNLKASEVNLLDILIDYFLLQKFKHYSQLKKHDVNIFEEKIISYLEKRKLVSYFNAMF